MSLPKVQGEVARLWDAPELRFTSAGKAVCSVPLVFNKRRKNQGSGEWEDVGSMFVRASAWEQLAENCAESLSKGDEVIVSGELSLREYDRKDGSGKGTSVEMNIFAIGPSLSRATAKVAKVSRDGAAATPRAAGDEVDPWSSAPTGAATDDSEIPF
ncbi:single-stranded DNA-binding protein [Pseudonocardia sp. KRD-184]|uniref:Single-stranded DNA-binding protein n=1 Tax=Pseudonocardia oceani TaxID=2792013 RepID=A0ABS6UKC1_9PSEU|nr:single-stranded DNA-binding protein [Pseudonocardia oceani]MBW0088267.1 single-stranded DNA-binding protein [Pseudonocardia oceani]MBW0095049.1 single-stranded DNA-binding protein [Pseudonocardia oceani]MBW0121098.1 single-stranded DNA-binding protein [Pseudonocardia oceani]MBW0131216.1 single-stranded DNA-binding protein [Pseudonocardia oceani]MBW0132617.1 single-stranded DNA-binding protein [Pseudonocardia oceani]